jgi:hypothetical protein
MHTLNIVKKNYTFKHFATSPDTTGVESFNNCIHEFMLHFEHKAHINQLDSLKIITYSIAEKSKS